MVYKYTSIYNIICEVIFCILVLTLKDKAVNVFDILNKLLYLFII